MIEMVPGIELAKQTASVLSGGPVRELTRIGGGRNSQVYRVDKDQAVRYVMKLYFRDDRKRRANEFNGLSFLWNNGIRCIPEPLNTDESLGASLFHFISGMPVQSALATETDMDASAEFLLQLREMAKLPGAAQLPSASEAMFSLDAIENNIKNRYRRLHEVDGKIAPYAEMHAFLRWNFAPALGELTEWAAKLLLECGLSRSAELPAEMRTLSPSDFGFHNALRTESGLAFVDFEYFGWDDPAKMISDFLLHPGMEISHPLKGRFLRQILQRIRPAHALDSRTRIGYALYGLKWCMILLNEFVPEHLERRLFNDPNLNVEEHQRRQLGKARTMLAQARAARETFPYEDWIGS